MEGSNQGAMSGTTHARSLWRAGKWALALSACPGMALAVSQFVPYAQAQYEYDTNYFAIASGIPDPVGSGGATRAVGYERYKAGFEADYDWSQQEFFAIAEGRRFQFQDFGELNHNEYLVHPGLRWKLASIFDGVLDYSRERTQVSFLQFNATQFAGANLYSQLFLQVQDLATASINVQFLPDWRLESEGKYNHLESPRPGLLDLTVREVSDDEGIRYVGFANLSAGLVAEYLSGRYSGAQSVQFFQSPTYHQTSVDFAADYKLSGLSLFHGAVGYTKRSQGSTGSLSGLTGVLQYQRQLTGKTAAGIKVARAVNEYITGATPEIDTTVQLDAIWNATSKIGVSLSYQYMHASISGTDLVGVTAPGRTDHMNTPSISVAYQALDWLSVKPYYQYQSRSSTDQLDTFLGVTYGVQVEVRFNHQPQPLTLIPPGP